VTGTFQFDQAANYSLVQLAELVTAAFHGYALPVFETPARLARLVRMQGLDLAHSVVIHSGGQLVGVSFLGLRNTHAWVSAFGIVPAFRGRGLAKRLMDHIFDQARAVGAQDVRLEVLVGNVAARRVYGQSGFRTQRELVTLERAPWSSPLARNTNLRLERVDVETAVRHSLALEQTPACWQREAPSLITGSADGLLVYQGTRPVGCALHSSRDGAVALHHICATPASASSAVGAILVYLVGAATTAGRHVTVLNEPDPKGLVSALASHGFRETMRQLELQREL
jgi:GNAT superfamily N-acetyltransferase